MSIMTAPPGRIDTDRALASALARLLARWWQREMERRPAVEARAEAVAP